MNCFDGPSQPLWRVVLAGWSFRESNLQVPAAVVSLCRISIERNAPVFDVTNVCYDRRSDELKQMSTLDRY
jgi:hypothetical protein